MWKLFVGFFEYAPLWIFIHLLGLLKYDQRMQLGSSIIGLAIRRIPRYRKRVLNNLRLIYPEISKIETNKFLKDFSENLGLTFTEFLFNQEFHENQEILLDDPTQLDEIYAALQKNQPIIITSGHFGPWEAVRALLKRKGMETGAIYRKSKNRFYQPYHHKTISVGGTPVFQTGRKGTAGMVRHLKKGGIVCIMIDQAVSDGKYMNFLGKPAKTTLAIANLALRYNALMVPAYAIRKVSDNSITVVVEPSISPSTPQHMTEQATESLTNRITQAPTHWYWLHNRWK